MTGVLLVAIVLGIPALAFVAWPLVRKGVDRTFLPVPPDEREQLTEQKRAALAALRELEFEHAAGHLSDDDFAELRARYETEAARVLTALDRLGAPADTDERRRPAAVITRRSAWQHPIAIGVAAVVLIAFGVALGAGIVRNSTPESNPSPPMVGSRPLADLLKPFAPPRESAAPGRPPRAVTPEVMHGMLQAARSSLFEGRYGEAIAAYQAVLKRDPKNVDAITHLGLIVAIGGHVDTALESLDRALAIDPKYPPALFYRGQILYEAKHDVAGAMSAWEKFLTVAPPGEDRDRVAKMIAEAKSGARPQTR